jgi:hypothetical protein
MLGQCFNLPCRQLHVVGIEVAGGRDKAGWYRVGRRLAQPLITEGLEAIHDLLPLAIDQIGFLLKPLDGEFLAKFDRNASVSGHPEFPQPGRKLVFR